MKYKIGNTEVEAVQWNGDNKLITDTWPAIADILSTEKDAWDRDILSISWVSNRITHGDYIIKSKDGRMFVLGQQDFNNMITKVKEPCEGDKYFNKSTGTINTINRVDLAYPFNKDKQICVGWEENPFITTLVDLNNFDKFQYISSLEAKFKVGDKVYLKDEEDDVFNCEKCVIERVCKDGDFIHYHLEGSIFKVFKEHELLTLEEAIEKLKEL